MGQEGERRKEKVGRQTAEPCLHPSQRGGPCGVGRARSKERPSSLCAPPPPSPINRPSPGCGSALGGSRAPGTSSSEVEPPASMASEFKKKIFWRAVVAEFLAMTLFVFISIGSALGFNYPLGTNQTHVQDNVKVSLAFGLSIATLAQSVGHISGAHLNPAVTLGLLLSCQISILRAVMYIIAQCVGAIVATAILSGITSSLIENSLGRNDVSGVSSQAWARAGGGGGRSIGGYREGNGSICLRCNGGP